MTHTAAVAESFRRHAAALGFTQVQALVLSALAVATAAAVGAVLGDRSARPALGAGVGAGVAVAAELAALYLTAPAAPDVGAPAAQGASPGGLAALDDGQREGGDGALSRAISEAARSGRPVVARVLIGAGRSQEWREVTAYPDGRVELPDGRLWRTADRSRDLEERERLAAAYQLTRNGPLAGSPALAQRT